jgi:monoamine oxidase
MRELVRVRRATGDRPVSLDEAIHVAARLTRRDVLRAGLVAGVGLALSACTRDRSTATAPRPTATVSEGAPRVVVVGAGLAGLTAAYRLHQAGVPVEVYEARDRIGGRCFSSRDWEGGQVGEHGGEFVDTRHVHLRILADELGLRLDDLWSSPAWNAPWLTYLEGEVIRPGDVFGDLWRAADQIVTLAARGPVTGGAPDAPPIDESIRELDAMTEADWYAEHVGPLDTPAYRLFTQGQAGWYGLDPDVLSAANLIDFLAIDYPGGNERYTIHGGNDQVPAATAARLPPAAVHLETPLQALRVRPDGRVELRFDDTAAPVVADRAIVTIPFTTLRAVDVTEAGLSPTKQRAIDELGMGTNAKVLLQVDRPFGSSWWGGGLTRGDDPVFDTWESGSTDGVGAGTHGLLTVYSGGRVGAGWPADEPHAPASREVVDLTLSSIEVAVPGISDAFGGRAWLDAWVRDPWVGGSYAALLPGQWTGFWGAAPIAEGPIHFAGEHTSFFSQGFLNGGVESGSRAAAEVLRALGLRLPDGLRRSFAAARDFAPRYPWET